MGQLLLILRTVKDDSSVLVSDVFILSVQGRWIVDAEKDIEELGVGDNIGIKG